MEVGLRVIRGPDWKWGSQDDGEGHVGTVVEVGRPGSTTPDRTVVVQWDSGSRTNYRVGYQGAFDLRLVDNSPVGVKHLNVNCSECEERGMCGIRWSCSRCDSIDLCTRCYMSNKHDTSHEFYRHDTSSLPGLEVPARRNCRTVELFGIFTGATVVRGPDWDWGNQDGGEGKTGTVTCIQGWDESKLSVASVTWASGSQNVYRVGHKGKVDLKYTVKSSGGHFYIDHLPILGHDAETHLAFGISKLSTSPRHCQFNVGDKVRVVDNEELLKKLQPHHGGWNPRMSEHVGKEGYIHRITERGDLRVKFEGCDNRWTFNPKALIKVGFSVGDMIRVVDNIELVKENQVGHGEWTDVMKSALGEIGKIQKVYMDGDLRVNVKGQTWTMNPACVTSIPAVVATEHNNSMHTHQQEEQGAPLLSFIHRLLDQQAESGGSDKLVRLAAQGSINPVREFLKKYPEKVDQKSSGKTCLQVACHQGHIDIVKFLLAVGASMEVTDDDGDTALHYASFGNQPEIMDLLLKKDARIDIINKGHCSCLHVAVNKQHLTCVQVLLKYKCNVNIQDSYGDTALHDAIGKESNDIITLLCGIPNIDFSLRNKRGFNVLHHAALKGNSFATKLILRHSTHLVDVKKDDGFAAIHLASLNGHSEVAGILITCGQCQVDIQNNRKQTPLLLAVSQGQCSLVELLVQHNANVNATDEDGDTALHHALMKSTAIISDVSSLTQELCWIITQLERKGQEPQSGLVIASFLVGAGANMTIKNNRGKSPTDLATENQQLELLQWFTTNKCKPSAGGLSSSAEVEPPSCSICMDMKVSVIFEPCGHKITCEECSARMKKCLQCQEIIMKKVTTAGKVLSTKSRLPSTERLQYLEKKIQEIEETQCCSICMERRKNVAFMCGHVACVACAQTLKTCHMCRKPITGKINIYP